MPCTGRRTSVVGNAFQALVAVAMLVSMLALPGSVGGAGLSRTSHRAPRATGIRALPVSRHRVDAAPSAADVRTLVIARQKHRALSQTMQPATSSADDWLHGVGSQLYTARNEPITLKAINWYGFEYPPFVPDGLDRASLDSILFTVRHLGFNALRISFADETVKSNPVVRRGLTANPTLRGHHALDIMEQILRRAHHFGLRVILCNSRSEAGWGPETLSGLWYTAGYPASTWVKDWVTLVKRFRKDGAFVGADLRNEPHVVGSGAPDAAAYFRNGPIWGPYRGKTYRDRDWRYAAQTLGNTLLRINSHLLIIVEGVQMYLNPASNKVTNGLWGSNLIGVQYQPVRLIRQSQLVYSVHDYGPHMWQGDWFNPTTTYASLAKRWTTFWGYLLGTATSLRAPIFVGEFGTCHNYWSCISATDGWKQGFWFASFVRYLHEHPEIGWAYWSLNSNGPFHPQDPNYYSLFSSDWHHYYPLLTRGLAPLLREPDGGASTRPKDHLQAFPPQPGCSPDRSCVSTKPKRPARTFSVRVTRNVPYIPAADPYRMGDLYVPQNTGKAARAAVVIVHGGSWDNGRKGTPGTVVLARDLAQHGYVTFDINYRLSGRGGQYPKNIQDVEDAVAYLSVHGQQLHIDPGKLGVVGASAGGYLALMAGYRPNVAPFTSPHYPRTHVHIQAIGSLFAPVELKASVLKAIGLPRLRKLSAYMGTTYQRDPTRYKMASPLRYADTAVPTALWYGRADPMTPLPQTFELYKRLRQRQVRADLFDLPGAPHSVTELSRQDRDTAMHQLLEFLDGVFFHPAARGR